MGVESDFRLPIEPVIGTELICALHSFLSSSSSILWGGMPYIGLKSNLFGGYIVLTSAIGYMALYGPGKFQNYDDNNYQYITEGQFCVIFRVAYSYIK